MAAAYQELAIISVLLDAIRKSAGSTKTYSSTKLLSLDTLMNLALTFKTVNGPKHKLTDCLITSIEKRKNESMKKITIQDRIGPAIYSNNDSIYTTCKRGDNQQTLFDEFKLIDPLSNDSLLKALKTNPVFRTKLMDLIVPSTERNKACDNQVVVDEFIKAVEKKEMSPTEIMNIMLDSPTSIAISKSEEQIIKANTNTVNTVNTQLVNSSSTTATAQNDDAEKKEIKRLKREAFMKEQAKLEAEKKAYSDMVEADLKVEIGQLQTVVNNLTTILSDPLCQTHVLSDCSYHDTSTADAMGDYLEAKMIDVEDVGYVFYYELSQNQGGRTKGCSDFPDCLKNEKKPIMLLHSSYIQIIEREFVEQFPNPFAPPKPKSTKYVDIRDFINYSGSMVHDHLKIQATQFAEYYKNLIIAVIKKLFPGGQSAGGAKSKKPTILVTKGKLFISVKRELRRLYIDNKGPYYRYQNERINVKIPKVKLAKSKYSKKAKKRVA